jgi:hypothetical protein
MMFYEGGEERGRGWRVCVYYMGILRIKKSIEWNELILPCVC